MTNHLTSKKTRRVMEVEEIRLLCSLHGLEFCEDEPSLIFCPFSNSFVSKSLKKVKRHIKGKKFQRLVNEENNLENVNPQFRQSPSFKLQGIASPQGKSTIFSSPNTVSRGNYDYQEDDEEERGVEWYGDYTY